MSLSNPTFTLATSCRLLLSSRAIKAKFFKTINTLISENIGRLVCMLQANCTSYSMCTQQRLQWSLLLPSKMDFISSSCFYTHLLSSYIVYDRTRCTRSDMSLFNGKLLQGVAKVVREELIKSHRTHHRAGLRSRLQFTTPYLICIELEKKISIQMSRFYFAAEIAARCHTCTVPWKGISSFLFLFIFFIF